MFEKNEYEQFLAVNLYKSKWRKQIEGDNN